MYISVKSRTSDCIIFTVVGCDLALANALRRVMIAEVDTWAIEYVDFVRNTTVLNNNFIAHRLGLIPLSNPTIKPDTDTVELQFDMTAGEDPVVWNSGLLKSDHDDIFPVIDDIPIVKAARGQKLKFTAHAKQGIGLDHSKWSPVSTCFFVKTDIGYEFTVETIGTMDPADVVRKAIDKLKNKLDTCMNNATIV